MQANSSRFLITARLLLLLLLFFTLPLLGAWIADKPLSPYFQFPPKTMYREVPAFSWDIFCLLSVIALSVLAPFVIRTLKTRVTKQRLSQWAFPGWGWAGLLLLILSWLLAWTRFPWFSALQQHTFFPLWLGYILVINGLSFTRTGHCLLRDRTKLFLFLFPLSAVFWWGFEYLNRYAGNWYYVNLPNYEPWEYFLITTLPFATVLPAVLSTAQWLLTYTRLSAGLQAALRLPFLSSALFKTIVILLAVAGLIGIGSLPDVFYPMVWVSPMILALVLGDVDARPSLFREIKAGNWQRFWIFALAGLLCGFFWEMWNIGSLAHWKYSVPFVQGLRIFEMPLIGYAGYLPFGITCGAIVDLFRSERDT